MIYQLLLLAIFLLPSPVYAVDNDGDGWTVAAGDCDDNNLLVHPAAIETCNGYDDNCNSQVDEGVLTKYYPDNDGDLFGFLPSLFNFVSGLHEDDSSYSIVWGDIDNDGDLDLVVGSLHHENKIYANDGFGNLSLLWDDNEPLIRTTSVALGDADGDGDLDLAIGDTRSLRIYRNDGSIGFRLITTISFGGTFITVVWGDVDNDGDNDLAVSSAGSNTQIYSNHGSGNFVSSWTTGQSYDTHDIALGDVDDDGDLDLFISDRLGPNHIYLNNGNGTFVLSWSSPESFDSTSVVLGDADGDGDLDLAVGNYENVNQIYFNDGFGMFTWGWASAEEERTIAIAWDDIDSDGDLDLAVGNSYQGNGIYFNDGAGFLILTWTSAEHVNVSDISLVDMDGDNDLDLTVAHFNGESVYFYNNNLILSCTQPVHHSPNNTDCNDNERESFPGNHEICDGLDNNCDGQIDEGVLTRYYPDNDGDQFGAGNNQILLDLLWSSSEIDRTRNVALGDVDNDGDLDLVVGNDGNSNRLYKNDGFGNLTLAWSSSQASATTDISLGDMDGDGDLDLAVGNHNERNSVYANDGSGHFTLSQDLVERELTQAVSWGDMDGDGDLDLAFGNYGQHNTIYVNDGSGHFTWFSYVTERDSTQAISWGDMDGDGDLDLVVGNEFDPDRLYQNDGTGILTLFWNSPSSDRTNDIALGDTDGDGDLDLITGNDNDPARLYQNDGTGHLVLSWSSIDDNTTRRVALIDFDRDGDLDFARDYSLYENDGLGNFIWSGNAPEMGWVPAIVWGDMNGDGSLDLVVGKFGEENRLYIDSSLFACSAPLGYVTDHTDCNDSDEFINPSISETCDGLDNNCDGQIDEGAGITYYRDLDDDGFGDPNNTMVSCTQPAGFVLDSSDCNDNSDVAFPGNPELCDDIDNNCNGIIDEGIDVGGGGPPHVNSNTYYIDRDGDGYGADDQIAYACNPPAGFVSNHDDCDDSDGLTFLGASEQCDGVDNDCDGLIPEDERDHDGDGQTVCTGDCDDSDGLTFLGASEQCDGIDNDCDGLIPEDEIDTTTYTVNQYGQFSGGFAPINLNNATILSDTEHPLFDDSVTNAIPLGFTFEFYGQQYSSLYLSSNGWISFSQPQHDGCCEGQFLPYPESIIDAMLRYNTWAANLIAFWWEDLQPDFDYPSGETGVIQYQTVGVAPARTFVLELIQIPHCCNNGSDPISLQLHLKESDHTIEIHYSQATGGTTGRHTVGVLNESGIVGTAYLNAVEDPPAEHRTMVRFTAETEEACGGARQRPSSGRPSPVSDLDGDGFSIADGDCDDTDPALFPRPFFPDNDGDGFGRAIDQSTRFTGQGIRSNLLVPDVPLFETSEAIIGCGAVAQHADNALDCDDAHREINPDALEQCDRIDNNCNGLIDEGLICHSRSLRDRLQIPSKP